MKQRRDFGTLDQERFVEGWTRLVGEPPAVLLDDRRAMVRMLVTTSAALPLPSDEDGSEEPSTA